jgi:hypothetical protein
MLGLLASVPVPSDPRFPQAVRRVLDDVDDPEPALRAILEEHSVRPRARFAALYGLLLRMRREDRYGEYAALVAEHENGFSSQPYYHTFRAIVAQMKGDLASLRSAVEYSRQAALLLPEVAAVVHQLPRSGSSTWSGWRRPVYTTSTRWSGTWTAPWPCPAEGSPTTSRRRVGC